MKRLYLKKVCFKKRTPGSLKKLKSKRVTAVNFTKEERRKYFKSRNPNATISDKKKFLEEYTIPFL